MEKIKYIQILFIGLLIFIMPNGANAGPAEDACNDAVVGQRCDFTTPVQNIRGGGQSGGPQTGFCDRSNGNPDANSNPLICRSSQNQNTNFQTDWEDCAVAGDRCRSGGTDGTCASRTVGSGRGQRTEIYCNTTSAAPSGAPGGAPGGAPSGAPGGVAPGTSSSPSTTAGTVSYESYTNFPGVGRIKDLCQLINALWLLGFAVLLTSVLGMFLYGGYIYVTAGVNAGKVNQAKEIFTNTITGLIIGLSIFIIINIINPGLLQGNCSIPSAGSGTPGTPSTPGTPGTPGTSVPGNRNCDGCVSLRSQGVTVADWNGTNGPGRTDRVMPQVAAATKRVQDEMASLGIPIHITAAWTNGVGHSAGSQHYQGLAVDMQAVSGTGGLQQIATACRNAGFTFVLVESYHTHCDMR